MSDQLQATLKVSRGAEGEAPRYDSFDVPFEEGASVLDAQAYETPLGRIPVDTDVARALPGPGVDTPADLERVRQLIRASDPGSSPA